MSPVELKPTAAAAARAKKREQEARVMFLAAKNALEAKRSSMAPGSIHKVQLLTPAHHLTSTRYATFCKWIKKHPGWKVRRRTATDEEKAAYKASSVATGKR